MNCKEFGLKEWLLLLSTGLIFFFSFGLLGLGQNVVNSDLAQRAEDGGVALGTPIDDEINDNLSLVLTTIFQVTIAVGVAMVVVHVLACSGLLCPSEGLRHACLCCFTCFACLALVAVAVTTALFFAASFGLQQGCDALDDMIDERNCSECFEPLPDCLQRDLDRFANLTQNPPPSLANASSLPPLPNPNEPPCYYNPDLLEEICDTFQQQLAAIASLMIFIGLLLMFNMYCGCCVSSDRRDRDMAEGGDGYFGMKERVPAPLPDAPPARKNLQRKKSLL